MKKQNKKGFTIIEVVLVLAIAGLIFLMVFIALPALQRSQRNTQRGDDLSRILTAANDYQTNNSGNSPFNKSGLTADDLGTFIQRYIDDTVTYDKSKGVTKCGDQFKDPDGECYGMVYLGSMNNTSATAVKLNPSSAVTSYASFTVSGTTATIKPNTGNGQNGFDHIFYAVTYASCGSTEDTLTKGTGERQYAIFFIEEGGAISCNDNH